MKYPWTWFPVFPVFSKKSTTTSFLPLLLKPPATKSTSSSLTRIHPPPTLIFLKGFFLHSFRNASFLDRSSTLLEWLFCVLLPWVPSAFTLSKATTADESIPPPSVAAATKQQQQLQQQLSHPPPLAALARGGRQFSSVCYALLCQCFVISHHEWLTRSVRWKIHQSWSTIIY